VRVNTPSELNGGVAYHSTFGDVRVNTPSEISGTSKLVTPAN
jgi:hypothetical protein